MSRLNQNPSSAQTDEPDLGTLAVLPLEIRQQILVESLNIDVAINTGGIRGAMTGRQYLPPALEQDLEAMGGVQMESYTYIFQTPAAFQAFFSALSIHNRGRIRRLRLNLFATLKRGITEDEYNAHTDGWRGVFRVLPGTVQLIILGMGALGDTYRIQNRLASFSLVIHIKSKGRCRFIIDDCLTPCSRDAYELSTLGVIKEGGKLAGWKYWRSGLRTAPFHVGPHTRRLTI